MEKREKTVCPVTAQQFEEEAIPILFVVGPEQRKIAVGTKQFSTGSFGWFHQDRMNVGVGEETVKVQLSITITVVGSKEAPRE
jgi:hypothetical protein